jgi:polar amino acid transport system substrate-binding protein
MAVRVPAVNSLRILSAMTLIAAALIAGCGDDDEETADTGRGADAAVPAAEEAECTPDQLETVKDGKLTIATDSPAYEPYFVGDDPTNGKGFESAVAYAVADELGFAQEDVKWTVVPFNASYAPGPKDFDFDVNQISITAKRAQQVDFSSPYYTASQAVVALKDSPAAEATSLADLADAKIGVQIGTTSLDAVEEEIGAEDTQVFDTSNDVVSALKQGQVDAIVVDLPTGLYLTAVEVPEATVAGQFEAPGGDEFAALLEKDSPLTGCVSLAIDTLRESGELDEIEQRWMSEAAEAPVLE